VGGCLSVMKGTLETLVFDSERAAELTSGGFTTATDLADYLASRGMDFPQAHRVVGEVVTHCLEQGKTLEALTVDELAGFSELLDADALEWLAPAASIARRSCAGGTAPDSVRRQIADARTFVSEP
jgi:argininosuccinate lyase